MRPITLARAFSSFCVFLSLALCANAQVPPPPNQAPPSILKRIGFDQKLGETLPLDLAFRNESGQPVTLGQYFGGKPVVLSFVYYECPMLCTMSLNSMLRAFKVMNLDIGRDFEVVTVSFDPRENAALAAAKKKTYIKQYNRPGAAEGWHFLTGDQQPIQKLTQACGFRYYYDANTDQYAHPSGIIVATPQGKLSHYFYGLEYSPKDVQLGLIEASNGRIGSLVDQVLLLCYQYDPTTGKYGWAIMNSLRIGGILTVLALGTFIVVSIRRDRRRSARPESGLPDPSENSQ